MSQNICIFQGGKTTLTLPFPSFTSREALETYFKSVTCTGYTVSF